MIRRANNWICILLTFWGTRDKGNVFFCYVNSELRSFYVCACTSWVLSNTFDIWQNHTEHNASKSGCALSVTNRLSDKQCHWSVLYSSVISSLHFFAVGRLVGSLPQHIVTSASHLGWSGLHLLSLSCSGRRPSFTRLPNCIKFLNLIFVKGGCPYHISQSIMPRL